MGPRTVKEGGGEREKRGKEVWGTTKKKGACGINVDLELRGDREEKKTPQCISVARVWGGEKRGKLGEARRSKKRGDAQQSKNKTGKKGR